MKQRTLRDVGFDHAGWRLEILPDLTDLPLEPAAMAAAAVAAAEGKAGHLQHRSRHAITYLLPFAAAKKTVELYVKIYRPAHGLDRLKSRWRGSRADNVIHMSAVLHRLGFAVPSLLLAGHHSPTGRTMLVSLRAEGTALPELLRAGPCGNRSPGWLAQKRTLLRALGTMVASLHAKGFVHGDLTPYNVFVIAVEKPRFVLLDHDRTRLGFRLGRTRRQLRNLVQLGRFNFASITEADRLRVFRAYAAGLAPRRYRRMLRRTARMLAARRLNDRSA
jgi:tRNA A-37 threonylcarbamoyl transferase component Bud32